MHYKKYLYGYREEVKNNAYTQNPWKYFELSAE